MIIELLKTIYAQLNIGWRVYRTRAVGTAQDPIPNKYIVYKLPSTSAAVDHNNRVLEITFWTKNQNDTTELDLFVEEVDKKLRRFRHIDEHHLLVFTKISQSEILDPDPTVNRRELRYMIKQSERNDY